MLNGEMVIFIELFPSQEEMMRSTARAFTIADELESPFGSRSLRSQIFIRDKKSPFGDFNFSCNA